MIIIFDIWKNPFALFIYLYNDRICHKTAEH